MIMKEEQAEASTSAEEVTAKVLKAPGPNAALEEVVELSNDELEGLITSVATTASSGPSDAGPSVP